MAPSLLTMVFTDLVNSTAIKRSLTGADVAARNRTYLETILGPHRERVEALRAEFDGRVVKTEGDAYFLVFDDAARAARWAVGLQICHRDRPIPTPLGDLQVKVGMHTGAPLPDPLYPGDLVGHEVDYAARVAALAGGGQITLSEATAALIRDAMVAEAAHAHGDRELKGVGAVPIFELLYADRLPQPLKDAALAPANLGPPPRRFTGRGGLVELVESQLHSGGLTILKGEGGMGKTTLALKAAYDAHRRGELPGGVAWINCELGPSLEGVLRQAAAVYFGDTLEGEPPARVVERIGGHLAGRAALLVLDNFETVARDAELVRWLASVRPPARVLLTTREAGVGLGGMVIPVGELKRSEAIALFRSRAAAEGAAEIAEAAIGDLCETVGDQPLAVELLAARAARLPVARLLERLRRDPGVIDAQADPTRPDRHQSAERCFALSFDALSEPARALLLAVAPLPSGAGIELVEALAGRDDWDDAAGELVAASLWRLSGDRYVTHPLVRRCALKRMGEGRSAAEAAAIDAVARLARAKARITKPGARGHEEARAAKLWFEAEWSNLLAVGDLAQAAGRDTALIDLALSIFFPAQASGSWREADQLYEPALAAAERRGDPATLKRLLNDLATSRRHQGRFAEAQRDFARALGIATVPADPVTDARSYQELCRLHQLARRRDEAEAFGERALALFRAGGDRYGEARTLIYLGNNLRYRGRLDEADSALSDALRIAHEIGDTYAEGGAWHYLGDVYRIGERWAAAEDAYGRSLALAKANRNLIGEAMNIKNLGYVYEAAGRHAEAEEAYRRSLAVFEQRGDRDRGAKSLGRIARLAARRGDPAEAVAVGRRALALWAESEEPTVDEEAELGALMAAWERDAERRGTS